MQDCHVSPLLIVAKYYQSVTLVIDLLKFLVNLGANVNQCDDYNTDHAQLLVYTYYISKKNMAMFEHYVLFLYDHGYDFTRKNNAQDTLFDYFDRYKNADIEENGSLPAIMALKQHRDVEFKHVPKPIQDFW